MGIEDCEFYDGTCWCQQYKIPVGEKKIQKGDGLVKCQDKPNCHFKKMIANKQKNDVFISFSHRLGAGNLVCTIDGTITTTQDVRKVEEYIMKESPGLCAVVVTNFIYLGGNKDA